MDSTDAKTASNPAPRPGLHKPFLERAAGGDVEEKGLGLGAFLVMRLVDQFGVDAIEPGRDAVEYQCNSTRSFVADIRPHSQTSSMLYEVTRVANAALESNDRRLLFPPLLALAYRLEEELRFSEALDVLHTAVHLSDGRDGEEELRVHLLRGRLLRNLDEFVEARAAYENAGAIAERLGDRHSEMLSRIGRGIIARQTGNLPESEQILRAAIADSHACQDRDAEARASQDLACTLYFAGRAAEATPSVFNAYELFEDPMDKARALSDTGVMLKALGHYDAAKNAFSLVLSHSLRPDVRARTEIECLEVSALIGDRVSFERWRQSIAEKCASTPKDVQLDFELQLGMGLAIFDQYDRAEAHIKRAIEIAEGLGMGERIFYAENQLVEVREQKGKSKERTALQTGAREDVSLVRSTIERLEDLAEAERD